MGLNYPAVRGGGGSAQGGNYIRPAQLQCSQPLHSGDSLGSVVRCRSPIEDLDFVQPSEHFGDPIPHGSYVVTTPGRPRPVNSASATLESNDPIVIPSQFLPSVSGVVAPQTLVFYSPLTHGQQQPHPFPSAGSTGPAPQPSGTYQSTGGIFRHH